MSKLIYGVGYNSRRSFKTTKNGKSTKAYSSWNHMIERCYSVKKHKERPTYIGCTVHSHWHDFQNFAEWYYAQDYCDEGYHLDKDLLFPNNKVYSPDFCCLVPNEINNLIIEYSSNMGENLRGAIWDKSVGKYISRITIDGKGKRLGTFDCAQEAHQAYKVAKELYVKEKALQWRDRIAPNVFNALMNWQLIS